MNIRFLATKRHESSQKGISPLWFLVVFVAILSPNTQAGYVTIGGTGVGADPATGYGAVNYTYQISQYEVTGAEFNAAATSDPNVGDCSYDSLNGPAYYVSWNEAVKYCNWLTSGNAYLGAYTHSGGSFTGIDRAGAISTYGTVYVLPTEDEWYKAAYWRDDINDQWSLYANGTDDTPTHGTSNGWNYYDYNRGYAYDHDMWPVGYGAQEQNGTYDMMGNATEWTEVLYDSSRYLTRGGGYGSKTIPRKAPLNASGYGSSATTLSSTAQRGGGYPDREYSNVGFRVVMVPEPSTVLLFCIGGIGAWILRRNRQSEELS